MKIKPTPNANGVVVKLGPEEPALPGAAAGRGPAALSFFQLKRILVPLDFSDCSQKALKYAIPFARQFGAELVLLHVVEPSPAFVEMPMLSVQSLQEASRALDTMDPAKAADINSTTMVRQGYPDLEIIEVAKELAADLIVLSTHGRTGLAHVWLGSIAEKVVRRAPCPVLVVREREHEFVTTDAK